MNFYIKTFGCRVNIAESEELAEKLKKIGLSAGPAEKAKIVIIRACSVTAGAEQGVRQAIRQFKKHKKIVYVLGCFLEKIKEADGYFKSDNELIDFLHSHIRGIRVNSDHSHRAIRTRVFIKIQEGCDFQCAFCITRILRGRAKRKSETTIINEMKEIPGLQEAVLTGTNILLYKDIHKLIKRILKETDIPRIRFGSVDPRLITENFIKLFKDSRVQPHLHLSLQSGSEKILREMGRPLKLSKIGSMVKKLREINPLFNFGADIIVGFPGESEQDFKKTLNLAKKLRLSKIHFFPYSPRPGTSAAALKQLPSKIISTRLQKIKKLENELAEKAKRALLDKKLTVLFEYGKKDIYYGYTPNFIRVKSSSKNDLTNKIILTIIKKYNLK